MQNILPSEYDVTVIIATAGTSGRGDSLVQAIESVTDQRSARCKVDVVFNGPDVSAELQDCVRKMPGVNAQCLPEPSLPAALNTGRKSVETRYFCFLDDDDIYLPNALDIRMEALEANPDVDVVVTNGLVKSHGSTENLLPDDLALDCAPMAELFRQNWLSSCGGLFRTSSVNEAYFRKDSKYFEWTMTAFLLSFNKNVMYLNVPTFVINKTAGSLSASMEYMEAYPRILRRMLDYPVDQATRKLINERLCRALHNLSVANRSKGNKIKAWRYHLRSLLSPGGGRYVAYSRHLFEKP